MEQQLPATEVAHAYRTGELEGTIWVTKPEK
jgi:hypothetical protein